MPSSRALGELKRMSSDMMNPEASTLADRIKAANQTLAREEASEAPAREERNDANEPNEEANGEAIVDDVAATAFALIDRFGGDIGSFAECCYKADDGTDDPSNYDEIDPSKYKDMFANPKKYEDAWNH